MFAFVKRHLKWLDSLIFSGSIPLLRWWWSIECSTRRKEHLFPGTSVWLLWTLVRCTRVKRGVLPLWLGLWAFGESLWIHLWYETWENVNSGGKKIQSWEQDMNTLWSSILYKIQTGILHSVHCFFPTFKLLSLSLVFENRIKSEAFPEAVKPKQITDLSYCVQGIGRGKKIIKKKRPLSIR